MVARRDNLAQALGEIEAQALNGCTAVVVNREWWDGLPVKEQEAYRLRAERAGVQLRADARLSSHYVEVRGAEEEPPLSSERPV